MASSCAPNRPHLNLRDGGEVSPWSLRGIIGNVKSAMAPAPLTPEQQEFERQKAEYRARAEAARSAPAPAPAAPAATGGISGYVGNSTLQARERAAGLKDGGQHPNYIDGFGGEVPGNSLRGDQFPAKYTGGEFVVSNAMLDAAPGLREQLHDLRGNVLAKQGKSVEQADAGAVAPEGLRAAVGGDWRAAFPNGAQDLDLTNVGTQPKPQAMGGAPRPAPVAAAAQPAYTPPKVDPTTGRYAHEAQAGQRPVVEGGSGRVGGTGGATGSVPAATGVTEPKSASLWGKTKAAGRSVSNGAKSVASGSFLNADVGAAAGRTLRSGAALGRSLLESPFTPAAIAAGGIVGAMQGANTGTEQYRLRTGMDPAGSLGGDLLARGAGVMADVGDAVTFGGATRLGNYFAGNGFNPNNPDGSAPGSPHTAPTPTVPTLRPTNRMGQNFDDPRLVNADPSRASLGASVDNTLRLGAVPKDLPSDLREGVIHKTIGPNGNPVYSGRNVSGDAQFVDGKGATIRPRGNVMSSSALREGASADSGVSAALAAAAARGDMDSVRAYYASKGESFGGVSAEQYREQQADAKAPKPGQPGYKDYMNAKVTKRGQDMDYDVALRGHEVTMGSAKYNARSDSRDQFNKDRDFAEGQRKTNFDQARQAEKDTTDHVLQMFTENDKDGKPIVNQAKANDFLNHLRQTAAAIAQDPNASPEDRRKYARGLSGLDGADRTSLFNLYRIKQAQMADRRGLTNPLGSTGDNSVDLRKYTIQGDATNLLQRRLRNEMGEVPETTLEYGGDANHFGWNSGPADTSLIPPKRIRD